MISHSYPKVTKAEVAALSRELSLAEELVKELAMENVPSDPDKRVEVSEKYRMANDALSYATQRYSSAFDAWAKGGFQE